MKAFFGFVGLVALLASLILLLALWVSAYAHLVVYMAESGWELVGGG